MTMRYTDPRLPLPYFIVHRSTKYDLQSNISGYDTLALFTYPEV